MKDSRKVVICLKNRTFAVSQTSAINTAMWETKLWFAWKIVLLQYHKHRAILSILGISSCDLLEKSYFCSITNIAAQITPRAIMVVICLKNRTFAVSQTSDYWQTYSGYWLWFAWKIVLLQYHKHHLWQWVYSTMVVICLKNRTFAVSQTSWENTSVDTLLLWFAWKIVLLQYHKHRVV